jgi:hypothetical protein
VVPAVAILCGAQACHSPTAPEPGEDVQIVLAVSGGIAGADWQLTIDGRRARIVGDRCRESIGCDWSAGEVLAPTQESQLLALAREFIEGGFLDLDETDYGTECCDQFGYELTYVDRDDAKKVLGSDGTLPDAVLELVGEVLTFVQDARGG